MTKENKEKVDQQLKNIFQQLWSEEHIKIESARIKIDWIDISPIGGEQNFLISELTIKAG